MDASSGSSEQRLQELLENNRALKSRIRQNVDSISTLRSIVESEFQSTRNWTPRSASSSSGRYRGLTGGLYSDKLTNNGSLGYSGYSSLSAHSSQSATPKTFDDYIVSYRPHTSNYNGGTTGDSPSKIDLAIENVQKRTSPQRPSSQGKSRFTGTNGLADEIPGRNLGPQEVSPVSGSSDSFRQPRRVFFTKEDTGNVEGKNLQRSLEGAIAQPAYEEDDVSRKLPEDYNTTLNALRSVRQSLKSASFTPERSNGNEGSSSQTNRSIQRHNDTLYHPGQSFRSKVGWNAQKQSVLQRWGGPLMQFDAAQSIGSDSDEETGEQGESFVENSTEGGSVEEGTNEKVDGVAPEKDLEVSRTSERLEALSTKKNDEGYAQGALVRGWIYKARLVPNKLRYKRKYCGVFRGARTKDNERIRNCIACYDSKDEMVRDIEAFQEGSRIPGRGAKGGFANASTVIDLSKLVVLSESPPLVEPPRGVNSLETSFQLHHVDVDKETQSASHPWVFFARSNKEKRKWVDCLKEMAANGSVKLPRHIRKELLGQLRNGSSFPSEREDVIQAFQCYREGDVENSYRMLLRSLSDPNEHEGRRFLCELYLSGIPGRYERGDPEALHKVAQLAVEGAQTELLKKKKEGQFCGLIKNTSQESFDLVKRGQEGKAVDVFFARLILKLMNA
eukprot:gb/GECG01006558.1/.p1 GENE.gb/GECG01006558.1/~~gb/GECG01006558.1/.p1  ORF type:complete len:673 (+),score=103.72 gb/GECG01006558.1/:1-2019(+)